MTKWADYLISAVKYTETSTTRHISKVKVHVDNGEKVGMGSIWTRKDVIDKLDDGSTFITITLSSDGKWARGASVYKIEEFGSSFIKTKADKTTKDNLGSLPELD